MDYKTNTLEEIISQVKRYEPTMDVKFLERVFDFGMRSSENRQNPYLIKPYKEHLLDMTKIAANLKLDKDTLAAVLLHETLMFGVPVESLETQFGHTIATIVKEYTETYEILENNKNVLAGDKLATIMLAISKDIRSVFMAIITAVNTLRFIDIYPENEKIKIAESIKEIYLPVCHKIGLTDIEWEIQDRCFKIITPEKYEEIKNKVGKSRSERETSIKDSLNEIEPLIKKKCNCDIVAYGRVKSFYSIYLKMTESGKMFNELNDLLGLRILCKDEESCYKILGVIHSNYIYLPEYFDDYISRPKKNHYKSIHTTVLWNDEPLEIQIRTEKMHNEAEGGIAAHWKYKKYSKNLHFDKKLSWARQLVERQRKTKNLASVFHSIEMQLGKREIFVLTPKKEVIVLPENSTPIDFAFAIHTNLGNKCKQARVNGKLIPLDYHLSNGDVVVIDTSKRTQTKRGWLGFVKSEKAKRKIRNALSIILKPKKRKTETHINDDKIIMAECCNPLPGDDCIIYKTTKRKLMVHKADCDNIKKISKEKIRKISSNLKKSSKYSASINVVATDRAGLLTDLLDVFDDAKLEVIRTEAKSKTDGTITCTFKINVKNTEQAENIIAKISCIDFVHSAERN